MAEMIYLKCPECENTKQMTQKAYDDLEYYPECPKCKCEFEEEDTATCNLCENEYYKSEFAVSFEDDDENEIDICKDCLTQIFKKAKAPMPQAEVKIVEKIVEKPVEKIVYKTIDKNGNEVGEKNGWTKFDCV